MAEAMALELSMSGSLTSLKSAVNKVVERYCAELARQENAPAIAILQRFLDLLDQAHAIIRERAPLLQLICAISG